MCCVKYFSLALLLLIGGTAFAEEKAAAPATRVVTFQSGEATLNAYVFRPNGAGPFPVVMWNNGSPKSLLDAGPVSRFQELAKFYVSHGYVLMIPDRRERYLGFEDGDINTVEDQEAHAVEVNTVKER